MKKIIFVFSVSLLAFSNLTQAGHNEHSRNDCGVFLKQYTAEAHVSILQKKYMDRKASCNEVSVRVVRNNLFFCTSFAESAAGPNFVGGASKACFGVVAGSVSKLYSTFVDNNTENNDLEEYNEGNYNVKYNATNVAINQLTINLIGNNTNGKVNEYSITLWKPNDTENYMDSVITPLKTIAYGKVVLLNGKITVTGSLFKNSDFKLTVANGQTMVKYIGNLTIDMPAGLNSNTPLCVSSYGDILFNEQAMFKQVLETNTNNELVLFPNPASAVINYAIKNVLDNNYTIALYDSKGNEINKELYLVNTDLKQINIEKLEADSYFVLLELSSGTKILKQFYKN